MGHFFPLFLKRDINELKKYNISLDLNGDIKDDILNYFMKTKPLFESFEQYLNDYKNRRTIK